MAAEAAAPAVRAPLKCGDKSLACAASPVAAVVPAAAIDPAGLLLFSVELDGLTLTDGLGAYGAIEDPLLPVGELTRLLELDVDVQPSERRVIGHIGPTRRSVIIDLATGVARDGPRGVKLTPEDVAVTASEIYLRSSAFSQLFPVKFDIDHEALSMKVTAQELLPVQGRRQRVAKRRELSGGVQQRDEVLKVDSPYQLFTMPAFDAALGVGAQATTPRFPLRYDIRIGADLLYTGFQGYLGSDENGQPSTSRLLFERRSLDGRLLGPLHARVVSVGDVFTPSLPLGPRSVAGRGVAFSTIPLDETNVFNRIDLRGELPLGYDVELYVNDVLRSGQNTPAKGRYEFLNVPLSQGVNVVRVVSYGPRGERSETTRIINVSGGQLRRGEATFELGVVQQDEPLFQVRAPLSTEVPNPGAGGLRAVGTLNYGLTQFLTVSAGAALIPSTNRASQAQQLYTAGLRTSLFGVATQLDIAHEGSGPSAAALGLAGQLFGASVVARHAEFRGGFVDENGSSADAARPLVRRSEITVDGSLQFGDRIIPMSVRALRNQFADGSSDLSASARASGTLRNILVSAGLEYQRTTPHSGSPTQALTGYFAGSTFRDFAWQLRATLDYALLPELRARTVAVTADRQLSDAWALRFGLGQPLDNLKGFNLTAASIHKLRFADLIFSGDYNNADQSWRLGVQLNFGLIYNPIERRYDVTRIGPGSGGAVAFHAFMDRDGDGTYDPGEEPVPNVTLEGGETRAVTGRDGRVMISGIGSGPTARLLVGLDRVENTSVQTPPTTVQFSPRPGSRADVSYPMRPTGEVMIKILLRRPDGKLVGLSAAQVRLVSDKGLMREAGTEFDGSANFPDLPAGEYRLELDPDQATRLRMRLLATPPITIKGDGGLTPDVQAEVAFAPRPAETDEAQPAPSP